MGIGIGIYNEHDANKGLVMYYRRRQINAQPEERLFYCFGTRPVHYQVHDVVVTKLAANPPRIPVNATFFTTSDRAANNPNVNLLQDMCTVMGDPNYTIHIPFASIYHGAPAALPVPNGNMVLDLRDLQQLIIN